jgi:hypothetical protein
MKALLLRPRTLLIAGLVLMVAGALDPMEGSVVILFGSAVATTGAFLGHGHRRAMQAWALVLIAVGVGLLFGMSAIGGVGGSTGRSAWWLLAVLPYPIGWVLGLVAVSTMLRRRSQTDLA